MACSESFRITIISGYRCVTNSSITEDRITQTGVLCFNASSSVPTMTFLELRRRAAKNPARLAVYAEAMMRAQNVQLKLSKRAGFVFGRNSKCLVTVNAAMKMDTHGLDSNSRSSDSVFSRSNTKYIIPVKTIAPTMANHTFRSNGNKNDHNDIESVLYPATLCTSTTSPSNQPRGNDTPRPNRSELLPQ